MSCIYRALLCESMCECVERRETKGGDEGGKETVGEGRRGGGGGGGGGSREQGN